MMTMQVRSSVVLSAQSAGQDSAANTMVRVTIRS